MILNINKTTDKIQGKIVKLLLLETKTLLLNSNAMFATVSV